MNTAQMLAQMGEWDKAGLIPADKKRAVEMLTSMGDDADEFMTKSIYDGIAVVVEEQQAELNAEKAKEELRKDKVREFQTKCKMEWDALLEPPKRTENSETHPFFKKGLYYKKKSKREDGTSIYTYEAVSEKLMIIPKKGNLSREMVELALHRMVQEQNAWVEQQMKPKKSTTKKGSGSKKDMKDASAPELVHPDYTIEKAEGLYETTENGCWFKRDEEAKATYAEKKLYKAGQRDPLNPTQKLDKNIYLVKYKPVIRPVSYRSPNDNTRCMCAVAFKPMRNASVYAREQGFIGDCMVQCANAKKEGSIFCQSCSAKGETAIKINEYKYKKSGNHADDFIDEINFDAEVVCKGTARKGVDEEGEE